MKLKEFLVNRDFDVMQNVRYMTEHGMMVANAFGDLKKMERFLVMIWSHSMMLRI